MSKAKPADQAEKKNEPAADPATSQAAQETQNASDSSGGAKQPEGGEVVASAGAADPAGAEPGTSMGSPPTYVPDAAAAAAIAAFLADWREDVPAEAASGRYSPHVRDRFADQDHSMIPEGLVFSRGWVFVFEGGRFVAAAEMTAAHEDIFVPMGQVVRLAA